MPNQVAARLSGDPESKDEEESVKFWRKFLKINSFLKKNERKIYLINQKVK
jgi:hypothetical protein